MYLRRCIYPYVKYRNLLLRDREADLIPYDIDYSIWLSNPATGEFSAGPLRKGFDDCPRAGGGYVITLQAAGMLNSGLAMYATEKDKLRARLTTILVDRRTREEPYPLVTDELIEQAMSKRPLRVA